RAIARHERAEHRDRTEEPLHVVAERAAAARRRLAGKARERHEAARRLRDDVVRGPLAPRPRLPEAREARDDEARMRAAEPLPREARARERTAGEVLDQDVEVREQPAQDRATLVLAEIERDATLVPVEREKEDGHAVDGRIPVAPFVAALGRLDLDDVGAH